MYDVRWTAYYFSQHNSSLSRKPPLH